MAHAQSGILHAAAAATEAEKPLDLLERMGLDHRHLRAFGLLNNVGDLRQPLAAGQNYRLPVQVITFDGNLIQTSLEVPMMQAVAIREYNASLAGAGQKPPVTDDRQLWVPYDHVLARTESGWSALRFLRQYGLTDRHLLAFSVLNGLEPVSPDATLDPEVLYRLPIHIRSYSGPSISANFGIADNEAADIAAFNERLFANGIKPRPWDDHLMWFPFRIEENPDYGPLYRQFEVTDEQLAGCVFYLSPGHGGIDRGTAGVREGERICEDEYAYDITLRLARELECHGAQVQVLIRDEGIRDIKFLECNENERFIDGGSIPDDQKTRLRRRVDIANRMYAEHGGRKAHQRFLAIHIDFRAEADRHVDFDLYCHQSSTAGCKLAKSIQNAVERHFDSRLGGREFTGRIVPQPPKEEFFVIRETAMPAVLIELANINNESDQLRFIVIESRQRIAELLCAGFIADRHQRP